LAVSPQKLEEENAPPSPSQQVSGAIQEITAKAQLLVREEIELAKLELTQKIGKLVRGAAVGAAAGVFAFLGLIFLLHTLSWGLYELLGTAIWVGFLITTGLLFLLAGVAGFLAYRFVQSGTPPKPEMAIDEAQRIKRTVDEARR